MMKTTLRRKLWAAALLGVLAGFFLGVWIGAFFFARASSAHLKDLTGADRDQYVTLVALGYDATGDIESAQIQLSQLDAPNQELLVSGVLERAQKHGETPATLAALARLALALGAPQAALQNYLPTATPTPPPPTPTPLPPTPTPAPTQAPPTATPPPTAAPAASPEPTQPPSEPTATPQPQAQAGQTINVRSGPGTDYPIIASMEGGDKLTIVAKNPAGDWWQVLLHNDKLGWVYAAIVNVLGDASGVPVASNIAPPPPTPTPAAPPTPTPAPKPAVDFVVKSVRLWGPEENGGYFDGPSLHCGEKRQLRAIVLDANGQPLNGVTLVGIYSKVEQVTGTKGPGIAEWILGDGDGLRVIRDVDGRPVVSETADGMVTDPHRIPDDVFIAAGYCHDAASCQALRDANACHGHYSWDVTFQRTY